MTDETNLGDGKFKNEDRSYLKKHEKVLLPIAGVTFGVAIFALVTAISLGYFHL